MRNCQTLPTYTHTNTHIIQNLCTRSSTSWHHTQSGIVHMIPSTTEHTEVLVDRSSWRKTKGNSNTAPALSLQPCPARAARILRCWKNRCPHRTRSQWRRTHARPPPGPCRVQRNRSQRAQGRCNLHDCARSPLRPAAKPSNLPAACPLLVNSPHIAIIQLQTSDCSLN